jgi:hypothetical protein
MLGTDDDKHYWDCHDAADELIRLKTIIDDYAAIAAASAREIKQVRQSYARSDEKRCDSDMCGATRTDKERDRLQSGDPGYTDGISADGTSKTLAVIDSLRGDLEVGRLQLKAAAGEVERLRSQPCPYVTGTVTRYCTLTPFTLTDEEREAVAAAIGSIDVDLYFNPDDTGRRCLALERHANALRDLLKRLK